MSGVAMTVIVATVLLDAGAVPAARCVSEERREPVVRVIRGTTIVGDSDPTLWAFVLDVLPKRPPRIELLDLDSLSELARRKVRGFDAFVLSGDRTIVVIRQSATLRLAETGDRVDRLALASVIWHEMAHAEGLDEPTALEREQALWRRFVTMGLVDGGMAHAYIGRLREAVGRPEGRPAPSGRYH